MNTNTRTLGEPATPAVAPWTHTAILIGVFLLVTLAGALFQHGPGPAPAHPNAAPLYAFLITMEWSLVFFVWKRGLRRSGTPLAALIGGRWPSLAHFLKDAALAAGFWGLWKLGGSAWEHLLGQDKAVSIEGLLPRSPVEITLWIALSLSAGFSEELVFRGYFQRQFASWTKSKWIALFLQAALFGISHGYQGVRACLRIMGYGLLIGLLALWRKSLRPGMMTHAGTDILSGIWRL